jgi:hypothetical protein
MFVHNFRSLHARFDASGFGAAFAPRKPRHPLVRFAVGLLGIALLLALLAVALVVGSVVLLVGLLRRVFARGGRAPVADKRVVEGEFRVLRKPVLPLAR